MSDKSKIDLSKKGLPTNLTRNENTIIPPNSTDNVRGNIKPNTKSRIIAPKGSNNNIDNGGIIPNSTKPPSGNAKSTIAGMNIT